MTIDVEQQSGAYDAESGCILPFVWADVSTLIPFNTTQSLLCWTYEVLQSMNWDIETAFFMTAGEKFKSPFTSLVIM